ncbi:hypothetical protein FQN49_001725 [Arthroderma sp. PD_2]|nr:hypothetical protein FQN49_001725 [Arthroderma sp. PD_2]
MSMSMGSTTTQVFRTMDHNPLPLRQILKAPASYDSGYDSMSTGSPVENVSGNSTPFCSIVSSPSASKAPMPTPAPAEVTEAREAAKDLIIIYRTTMVELETRRLASSRKGLHSWINFWTKAYKPSLADDLCRMIERVKPDLDQTFKEASQDISQIINEVEVNVITSTHPDELKAEMNYMRVRIRRVVDERQARASQLMEWLRCSLESIPADIDDYLFNKLKKQVYGLDPSGHYHPNPDEPEPEPQPAVISDEELSRRVQEAFLQPSNLPGPSNMAGEIEQARMTDFQRSYVNREELAAFVNNTQENLVG